MMSVEARQAWFDDRIRPVKSVGLWTIKVDGVLLATGPEEELPLMFKQFNDKVFGPPLEPKSGGMG